MTTSSNYGSLGPEVTHTPTSPTPASHPPVSSTPAVATQPESDHHLYALPAATTTARGRASILHRVSARLIDWSVSLLGLLFGYVILTYLSPSGVTAVIEGFVLLVALPAVLTLWNEVFMQGLTGQSIGKRSAHICLALDDDGRPVGVDRAFLRYAAIFASAAATLGIFLIVDTIVCALSYDGRRIWDRVMHFDVVPGYIEPE